jgi:hypothetical protein
MAALSTYESPTLNNRQKGTIFWDVTPCNLVEFFGRIGGRYKVFGRTWAQRCARGRVTAVSAGSSGARRRGSAFTVLLNTKTLVQIEFPAVAGEHFAKLLFHWKLLHVSRPKLMSYRTYFYSLHLQGRKISQATWNKQVALICLVVASCLLHAWRILRPCRWRQNIPLKRLWTQTTRCHIREDTLQSYARKYLKSKIDRSIIVSSSVGSLCLILAVCFNDSNSYINLVRSIQRGLKLDGLQWLSNTFTMMTSTGDKTQFENSLHYKFSN